MLPVAMLSVAVFSHPTRKPKESQASQIPCSPTTFQNSLQYMSGKNPLPHDPPPHAQRDHNIGVSSLDVDTSSSQQKKRNIDNDSLHALTFE